MRKEPLPPQLQQIVDKASQKDPKDRYQKIATMRDELRAVLQQVAGCADDAGRHVYPGPRRRQRGQTRSQLVHRQIDARGDVSRTARLSRRRRHAVLCARHFDDRHRCREKERRDPAVSKSRARTRRPAFTSLHLPTRLSLN